jgi:transcriptional regulator with XRE-family HTH domain
MTKQVEGRGDVVQFAEKLLHFRTQKGISQAQLSRLADVTISLICHYEAGRRRPTYDTALAIARALGLTPYETAELLVSAGYGSDVDLVALSLLLGHPAVPEAARQAARHTVVFLRETLEHELSKAGQVQDGQEEGEGGSENRQPATAGCSDQ